MSCRLAQTILNAFQSRFIFLLILGLLPPLAQGATVTWVGGNGDWSTATNWSTGALPGPEDDVVIGGGSAITVTYSSGTAAVKSVQTQQAFTLSGGTLTVFNIFQADAGLTLAGGTLCNATAVTTNVASLVVQSGTLDGVTINGTLDVGNTAYGARLTVVNGLVLNGTALVGNPTNGSWGGISFAGTQSLSGNGTVVLGNNGSGYNALQVASGGTTLTIGAGIAVRGQAGQIGYTPGAWSGPADVAVVNQGTISADVCGGKITITGEPLIRLPQIRVRHTPLCPGSPV